MGVLFLMTDAQVSDERFLVLVNDMLSTGEIPNLLPDDEVENVINGVRSEVRSTGMQDTREQCWKFFIERVRRNLKVRRKYVKSCAEKHEKKSNSNLIFYYG